MWQYYDYSELYHHGVKGMKWGIRRSPEQLGHPASHRRKQSVGDYARKTGRTVGRGARAVGSGAKYAGRATGRTVSRIGKKAHDARNERLIREADANKLYKKRKRFTDQELDRAVKRVNSDQRLKDVGRANESERSKFIKNGTKSVGHTLERSGLTVVGALATGMITYKVHKHLTNTRGRDYADSVLSRGKSIKYAKERIAPNYTTKVLKKYGRTPITKKLRDKNDSSNFVSDVPLLAGSTLRGSRLKTSDFKKLTAKSVKGRYSSENVKRFVKNHKSYSDRVKWKVK